MLLVPSQRIPNGEGRVYVQCASIVGRLPIKNTERSGELKFRQWVKALRSTLHTALNGQLNLLRRSTQDRGRSSSSKVLVLLAIEVQASTKAYWVFFSSTSTTG